jgi:hypothetical protein
MLQLVQNLEHLILLSIQVAELLIYLGSPDLIFLFLAPVALDLIIRL